MENYNGEEAYGICDLGCATALLTAGFNLVKIKKNSFGKADFIFIWSEELGQTYKDYFSDNLSQNPRRYFENMRGLKSRLYNE